MHVNVMTDNIKLRFVLGALHIDKTAWLNIAIIL